jgi:transposase InsO family protein
MKKYSKTKICDVLDVPRSSFYYRPVKRMEDEEIVQAISDSFTDSHKTYGTLRIREDLKELGYTVSRLRIRRVMESKGFVSCYTKKKKPNTNKPVTDSLERTNIVAGKFNDRKQHEVLASDTTYIDISKRWHYLCPILDLSRRAIVGFGVSDKRDASLAVNSLYSVDFDLRKSSIFHSDLGSEFNNKDIQMILESFGIQRSFSKKGTPTDNAVLESFIKTVKIEFVNRHKFTSVESFIEGWERYVYWYNNKRRHSSLNYRTPIESKNNIRKK